MSDAFPIPFGRYQLVERLAVGGMAELFKARVVGSHGFQKPVVIKKILPHLAADASFVAMFIDEANITSRLDHPKIAQVLELGTIDDQLYIAMEFIDGLDALAVLRACAARKQPLPTHIAVHIAHEVLDALDYAHSARDEAGKPLGIVHRDISPSNVLISRRGDVKLADFGIAHAVERQQKTQTGTLKGKYGYMSPEQVVGGDLDGRSDLFSVGIVLSEMLMGRRLFTAPNELDVLLMVRDVKLDRLDKYGGHIEPELKQILLQSMAREPKARIPSAAAFRDALADWLFSKRLRVTPLDLASFIESLYGDHKEAGAHPSPSGSGPARPPMGTIAGPSTKAQELRAQDSIRLAREQSSQPKPAPARAAPPAVTTPVVDPPASASSTPPSAPRTNPRAPTAMETPRRATAAAQAPSSPPSLGPNVRPRDSVDIPVFIDIDVDQSAPALTAREQASIPRVVSDEPSGPVITIEGPDADHSALQGEFRKAPSRESNVSDLTSDLALDQPMPPPNVPLAAVDSPPPTPPRLGKHADRPDEEGDLSQTPAVRMLYKLAVDKASGLLVVEISAITKEIFFASGVPEYVASNVARELLGEYLVAQKVISQGELAMALAMMPHFGGKIGDTLVGLGLMKPLDVFRHLTRQVRDKIVDVCTWQKGHYRWYRGKRNQREAFPLGLDAFEVLGAGATAMSADAIETWARAHLDRAPIAAKNTRVVPEAFRLGTYPRDVYNRLDGRVKLRDWITRITSADDRLAFLRTLYLLVQTDLAYWAT